MGQIVNFTGQVVEESIQYACPKCGCVEHLLFGKSHDDDTTSLEWSRCAECGHRQDLVITHENNV